MSRIEVTGWTTWFHSEGRPVSLEGVTGIFTPGMRWSDYIEALTDKEIPYAEALRRYLVLHKVTGCGDWHQSDTQTGVPNFSDRTVAMMSLRAWAEFQAAVWSTNDGKNYSYFDFYMEEPEEFYDDEPNPD